MRTKSILTISLALAITCASTTSGGYSVTSVGNTGGYITAPYQSSFKVDKFNVAFARLNSISYTATGAISATATVQNPTKNTEYASINAYSSVTISDPAQTKYPLTSVFASASQTEVVGANSYGTIGASGSSNITGTIPTSELTSYTGVGSNTFIVNAAQPSIYISGTSVLSSSASVFAGLSLTYNYTPIGLTQSDPITPSYTSGLTSYFNGVPSGRWFDPSAANTYTFNATSPNSTFTSLMLPTGLGDSFTVTDFSGTYLGQFNGGQTVSFAGAGTTGFTISGVDPSLTPNGFREELTFNQSNINFTERAYTSSVAVPEPSSFTLVGTSIVLGIAYAIRRVRQTV